MSKKPLKIVVVIGHLVRDRIIRPDGKITEALGGIAYSLSASAAIADRTTRILPVCNVGYDLYKKAESTFGKFPVIDFSAVRKINRKNKVHELSYRAGSYRRERNIGEMPIIGKWLFVNVRQIDVAWLNYIGGDEFPPRYIRWLKARFESLVYLDYHSLGLGKKSISRNGPKVERYFRYNPRWRDYVGLADIVQMNNIELKSIFADLKDNTESVVEMAIKVSEVGPGIVIITREHKPLVVIEKKAKRLDIHVLKIPEIKIIDPTGCGDSFGAGFIASFTKNRDVLKACGNGLKLAHFKAGFSGLDGFLKLK
jgi:hypothetical protein